jgi:hypothetical protein
MSSATRRSALGQGWREALVRTIDALAGAATVAAV